MIDAAAISARGASGLAQSEGDVVAYVEPGKGRVLLEYDADPIRYVAVDQRALQHDGAGGGTAQARDDLEQRRLAATGRTDDREEFAPLDVEIDRPERVDRGGGAGRGKDACHAPQFDVRCRHDPSLFP